MQHILDHWSGGDGGYIYAIYSGLLALLVGLGLTATAGVLYKRIQCHDESCRKIGMHHLAGGQFTVCGRHYRHVMGLHKDHVINIQHIKQAHEEHVRKTRF